MSPLDVDYDMNYLNEDTPPAPGMVKTIGANGKVEWKRLVGIFRCFSLHSNTKYIIVYDKIMTNSNIMIK